MTNAALLKSPRWGLNLSDELCFWCKKPTGRKVIHGLKIDDEKAPDYHFRDYVPCKSCEVIMSKGIAIIQCTSVPNDSLPLQEGLYPTGVWVTITDDWIRSVFKQDAADKIIKDRAVNVSLELWDKLGLPNLTNMGVTATDLQFKETNFVEKK